MQREDILTLMGALLALTVPLFAYVVIQPSAPIPIHYGLSGPDRFIAPTLFPFFVLALMALTVVVWGVRFIYPLRENVEKFRRAYNLFVLLLSLALSAFLLASLLGYGTSAIKLVLAILLVGAGSAMYVSERNWALGFRNPWTLSSDRVWKKINREAGVFTNPLWISITLLLAGYAVLTVRSYLVWR